MITIPRHQMDRDLARSQAEALSGKEAIVAELARENLDQLYLAHALAAMHAAYRSVGDPEGRSGEFWESIVLATHAGTGIFALSATSGSGIELTIGQRVRVPAIGSTLHVDPLTWIDAHNLAVICRDKRLLRTLCSVPTSAMRRKRPWSDEFTYLWVDALQAYWRHDLDVLSKLITTLEATGREALIMPKALALQHYYPTIKLFYYVATQQAEELNSALAEALHLHKAYWGHESRVNDPDGYLALGPLAMACIAHDVGIGLTVLSDYLPCVLLEGERVGERPR